MATLAFTDAFISVGGNDLSAYGNAVDWTFTADALEDTAFGDTARSRIGGGLEDGSGSISFNQDFANGLLDDLLFPMIGTVVALIVRPASGVASSSNPQYTGNIHVDSYPPFGNSVGELSTTTLSFTNAGAVARAEA